jgi:hypothetical protein
MKLVSWMASKERKFKAWLFALTALSSNKMMWFWFSVLFCEQLISYIIEVSFFGDGFVHIGDTVATVVVMWLYFHYQSELGNTLLKIILDGDKEVKLNN